MHIVAVLSVQLAGHEPVIYENLFTIQKVDRRELGTQRGCMLAQQIEFELSEVYSRGEIGNIVDIAVFVYSADITIVYAVLA